MIDFFSAFFSLFFSAQNQWLTLFFSAFLSATLLPGNSEIIFSTLASQHILASHTFYNEAVIYLVIIATLGNSLGSFVTYLMARLLPKPQKTEKPYAKWALQKSEKYGVWVLLLAWLPVIGDLFCGIAGWLRFDWRLSLLFITLGKFVRYLVLLFSLYPLLKYILM